MRLAPSFSLFKLDEEINQAFENTLPITVPFGQWKFSGDVQPLMLQKINGVQTDYPQIVFSDNSLIKYSVFLGSGYWRIGLRNSNAYKNILRKTVNYVSTKSDNSQFRINVRSEFIDTEEVIIGAEFYNEVGELDNRGSHYYLAKYWAEELSIQSEDVELKEIFSKVSDKLNLSEDIIVRELNK